MDDEACPSHEQMSARVVYLSELFSAQLVIYIEEIAFIEGSSPS